MSRDRRDYAEPTDADHAIVSATEVRGELLRDGWCPTRERILEGMGRRHDGEPMPGMRTLPPETAGKVARAICRDDTELLESMRRTEGEL